MKNQSTQAYRFGLFGTLLILTAVFILVEVSFLIECSGLYFGDIELVANRLKIPAVILPDVFYFLFAQLLIHVVYAVIVWGVARLISQLFKASHLKTEIIGTCLWSLGLVTILLANRYYFPNSKYSSILLSWIHPKIAYAFLMISGTLILSALILAAIELMIILRNYFKRPVLLLSGSTSCCVLAVAALHFSPHQVITDAATTEQPNIIIIGVDSVRPDFLGFNGSGLHTPNFDDFLNQATVFSESLTALARTYPSWVSLLTGLYPKINMARTDLMDPSQLDLHDTLPAILQRHGYKTIYGIDDSRFSNVDQAYGFDQLITSPMGFNNFLLGTANDFPISNLLINTLVGKYLFPYTYANRAVFATYNPDTYIQLLKSQLDTPRTKPLFLVVHLCLPHMPYAWQTLPMKKVTIHHYQLSIERADQQFQDFMHLLQQDKLLEHSIVILLSDHGEAVELPGDRITDPELFIAGYANKNKVVPQFYPPNSAHEKVNMSGGHGTDVLGLTQYHTVLAFKTYGLQPNQAKVIPGYVSLMDIKPTLLAWLKLPLGHVNGFSLQDVILGKANSVASRPDFFTESDFSPEAIRTIHPEERKVLFEGIDFFKLDPKTARLMVRDDMLAMIISSKQYADFYGPWVLALYPQNKVDMMPILVNLQTGEWTNDLSTAFAQKSPAQHMLTAMKDFFGRDITTIK